MARVLGYMNAILRGKLGGVVHSANRYGEYIRQYVKPVNPNTQAQAIARGNFSNALSGWHSLTASQKNAWSAYATDRGRGLSGVNEFMSHRARAMQNAWFLDNISGAMLTPSGDETFENTGYNPPLDAPNADVSPPFDMVLITASITTDFTGEYTLDGTFSLADSETPDITLPTGTFEPGFGITAYLSNPISQESHFISNPEEMKVGVSVPFDEIASGTEGGTMITFSQGGINPANYQDFPVNAYSRATFYWEDIHGRKWLIGSQIIEVPEIDTSGA